MQLDASTIFLGSMSTVLAGMSYLYYSRAQRLQVTMDEASEHYHAMQKSGKKIAAKNTDLREQLNQEKEAKAKLEASIAMFQKKLGVSESEKEHQTHLVESLEDRVKAISEDKKNQLSSMTDQLKTMDSERAEAIENFKKLEASQEKLVAEARLSIQKELTDAKSKLAESNKVFLEQKKLLEGASSKTDTEVEIKLLTAKKKISQLDRLYVTMKNKYEMAEERNGNWTTALTKLSDEVIAKSNNQKLVDEYSIPTNTVGQKVAIALEAAGTSLIDDAFSQGATTPSYTEKG